MKTYKLLGNKAIRGLSRILGQEPVEFWLDMAGSTQSTTRCLAEVVRVDHETADACSIWLKPNALFKGYQAGQHVNLSVEINGVVHTRSYSFSNAPNAQGLLRLTVKQTPDGLVSRHLVNSLQEGTVMELGDVFGEMTLQHTQPNLTENRPNLLLLAAGSGITPMMSLIESLEQQQWPTQVTLISWARSPSDLLFDDALKAKVGEHFRYVRVVEQGTEADQGDFQGRPSAAQFKAVAPVLEEKHVYACGPDGFMNALSPLLGQRPASFHAESFTPQVLKAADPADVKTFPITLTKSNRVIEVSNDKPLLKALQEQGINPPHGCGMGICNTCSCEKLTGTTQNMQNNTVCGANNAALRLCVNAAQSALALDL